MGDTTTTPVRSAAADCPKLAPLVAYLDSL